MCCCETSASKSTPTPLDMAESPVGEGSYRFCGPLSQQELLIAVDAHSKWAEVVEMSQTTTAKTITALRHMFATHGIPEQLVSDNGPQFTSTEFVEFVKANGIKHTKSSPYHPATNGEAERFVRTFKEAMKTG